MSTKARAPVSGACEGSLTIDIEDVDNSIALQMITVAVPVFYIGTIVSKVAMNRREQSELEGAEYVALRLVLTHCIGRYATLKDVEWGAIEGRAAYFFRVEPEHSGLIRAYERVTILRAVRLTV